MFKTVRLLIDLIWLVDIMNLDFVECLDTTYELNVLFWVLAWFFVIFESSNVWEDERENN